MHESEWVAEVRRWLRYAEEDLLGAETALEQPEIAPRHACWLAQQAAEKALKAILLFLQIDFPRPDSPRHGLGQETGPSETGPSKRSAKPHI